MADAASVDQLLGPPLTLEEWIALAEDVPGEFIDGRLVEEEEPDWDVPGCSDLTLDLDAMWSRSDALEG